MTVDLHIHTYYSDGTNSPAEVAQLAAARGIGTIAICDHNNTKSHAEARIACEKNGISLITGAEIDAYYEGGNQHILAYDFDINNAHLNAIMEDNLWLLEDLSLQLIESIAKIDPNVTMAEYNTFQRNPRNGGWKGIDYLASKGYNAKYPDCMALYADHGCMLKRNYAHVREVCAAIKQAGGYAVLAHPADRIREDRQTHLERLVAYGIEGLECYYTSHTEQETAFFVDFCRKNGLYITAGADHHGEFAREWNGKIYEIGGVIADQSQVYLR